ncbi:MULTISPECIES: alpha-amylase family protein [Coprococcus]|jgi:amylosucrase|uniref:alpha-amylase family protein n=1 Tax=Coprococcus TaxID=33042 RepID=UPI000E7233A1|nr:MULTISPECIES: alpha-amylase family protein [Coprococcus]RJW75878.1 amylosucrase [Coprococcus sp. AF38-1]
MAGSKTVKKTAEYTKRFDERYDELKWLYCELYNNNMEAFDWLCDSLYGYYQERNADLKKLDRSRVKNPDWYKQNDLLGMMMYTNAFAGTLKGVKEKLPYVKSCGVNYLHFMPLLESPKGRDDGGYAVADFRKVKPELGTMEDLEDLTAECHRQGISCCLDFVMNHTSEDHEWARAARQGDPVARSRYFFYDDWFVPNIYEETVPEVFPTTAPGNFTWINDCNQVVMTTFYPYQWDLNYANPMVFNDMVGNMLYMANRGIDVIRLDAVPYIWKQIGTNCRNLPQVHTLVRMMRIISEIVCPGVLLLGEVVMEPSKVVPYFGTVDKPECHMLYNVTTMASTWNTIATKNVGLLKRQMDQVCALPKDYVFLNYLRCHDDIGWGLDYDWLAQFGIDEVAHKKFLNDYFTGRGYNSDSRGELYNDDPRLGDARLCGTTASLSGLEAGQYEANADKIDQAVACDLMLHGYLLAQSGIPVLYSGDEIGQTNDYTYKNDPDKWADSRYLHRGNFPWDKVEKKDPVAMKIFDALRHMEDIRASHDVFSCNANVYTIETGCASVLGIVREYAGHELRAFFNFSNMDQLIWTMPEDQADIYTDLISGKTLRELGAVMPRYGCWWFYR